MGGSDNMQRRRLGVGRWVVERLKRLRHFRGHGVHSPYIYNIVRRVFMHKGLIACDSFELYDCLTKTTDNKIATELQNIATICGYSNYQINPSKESEEVDFIIWTDQLQVNAVKASLKSGATIAVIYGGYDYDFDNFERELWSNHRSTIIKRRGYLLILNNHLPKQRFIL